MKIVFLFFPPVDPALAQVRDIEIIGQFKHLGFRIGKKGATADPDLAHAGESALN